MDAAMASLIESDKIIAEHQMDQLRAVCGDLFGPTVLNVDIVARLQCNWADGPDDCPVAAMHVDSARQWIARYEQEEARLHGGA